MMTTPSQCSPIVDEPMPVPQRWGEPEATRVAEALQQSSLFYWGGSQYQKLLPAFREHYPIEHLFPCSSGTASLHIAIASLRLKPGDEVIVPAITDTGSVLGVLHQLLVPVFADINPRSYNLDPASVQAAITPKTRAIIAVHLSGNPCALDAIMAIAREHDLVVIEDCAQAWGARYRGTIVGTMGDFGCYSFNDYKHLSCGEGGMVGTRREDIARHLGSWGDKCYNRVTGIRNPSDLAYNYRMGEPSAAICIAQLEKHDDIVDRRHRVGMHLHGLIQDIDGVLPPEIDPRDTHSFYNYIFRLDLAALQCTRTEFATALQTQGVPNIDGYLPDPIYRYDLFQHHNFFAGTWPIRDLGLTTMDYTQVCCPESETFLKDCVMIKFNEAFTTGYVEKIARALRQTADAFLARAHTTRTTATS